VILTVGQVQAVLAQMEGEHALLARLLYGTGMRLMEALWLRVKDVDFAHRTLIVREGKANTDRTLMLPQALEDGLRPVGLCPFPSAAAAIRARASGRRHHRFDQTLQRAFKRAVVAAGLADKVPRSGALISSQAERRPQPRAAQPVRWCRSAGPPPIREARRKPAWAARRWPVRLRRHRPRRGKGRRGLHDPRLHPPIRNQGAKAVSAVTSR